MMHLSCKQQAGSEVLTMASMKSFCFYDITPRKDKAIPVTRRGDPQGCETSRLPHFLDNRLIDGGEVFSLTPPFTSQKDS
jgi:hypothetical protein